VKVLSRQKEYSGVFCDTSAGLAGPFVRFHLGLVYPVYPFWRNKHEIQISRLAARYRDRKPKIKLVIWNSARNSDFDGMNVRSQRRKKTVKSQSGGSALKLAFQDSILILSGQI